MAKKSGFGWWNAQFDGISVGNGPRYYGQGYYSNRPLTNLGFLVIVLFMIFFIFIIYKTKTTPKTNNPNT